MSVNPNPYWHPVHQCHDGIMSSVTGHRLDIANPTPEMIQIYDGATGLSHECRFGGQMHDFYSVAMHTLLVLHLVQIDELDANVKHRLCRAALAHDMSEAYLKDIPKPLKVLLGDVYATLERKWMVAIMQKWQIAPEDMEGIKPYDLRAAEIEYEVLRRQRYGNGEGKDWNKFLVSAGWFGRWPSRNDLRGRFIRICRNYRIV